MAGHLEGEMATALHAIPANQCPGAAAPAHMKQFPTLVDGKDAALRSIAGKFVDLEERPAGKGSDDLCESVS